MKPIAVVSILILTILAPIWENGSAATVQTSENRFAPLRSADAKRFDPNRLQVPNKKTVQNVPSQMPSNKMGQRQSPPALPISNMDSMRKSLEGNAVTLVPLEQSSQPKKKSKLNKRRRKQLKEKKQAEQKLADIASDGQDLLDVPNHLEPIQEANFLEEAESTQDSESFKDAPAVRESDSLKSVESAQESEFFETAESAQQAESFVQAESVKELEFLEAVLSSLETEFLQEAKSDRESKSQENAQALQESESVKAVESALESESFKTVESAQEPESFEIVESVQDSESVKAVESALESGSFETVESAQEPESFEIVKSVQDSESVKAVESAQETESCVTAEIAKRAESLEAVESALEADVLEEAEFLQDAPAAQESESLIAVESALEAGSMKATESALEVESKHASSVHEARFETDEYVGVDTTEFSHAAASLEAAEAVSSRKASDHGTLQQGVDIESPNSSSTPTLSLDNETSTLPASSPQRLYPVNNFNYLEESLSPNKGDREFDSTKASIGSDQRDIETPIADNGSISLDSLYYENTRRRNRKGNRIHKRLSVKQPTLRLWPKSRAGAARNQRMLLENQEQLIRLLFFNLYYYAKSVDPSSVQSSSNLPDSYHSHPSDTTVADSGSVEPLSSSPKKRSFDDLEDLEQPASKRFRVHLGTPSADQHMLQHDQYELEVMNLSTLPDQEDFHNLNVYPDELAKYTYYDSDVQNPNSRKTPKALETSDVDFATDSSSTIFEPIIMDGSRKSFIDEMSTAKYTNPAITSVEEQKTPDKASDANSLSDNLRESEITANSYSLPLSNPDLTQPETVQYQQNFFQFIWSRWWFKLIVLTAICTIIVALTTFFVRRHIIRRRRLSAFDNNIVFVDPHKTGSINMDSDQEDNFFSTASHMLRRGGIQINY